MNYQRALIGIVTFPLHLEIAPISARLVNGFK